MLLSAGRMDSAWILPRQPLTGAAAQASGRTAVTKVTGLAV
jgi:hypothetical protein